MIVEKYQNIKAAFQQWSERRAMRKWDNLPDETLPAPAPLLPRRRQWQAFGFAGGVFLAALAAPGISKVTRQEVVHLSLSPGRFQAMGFTLTGVSKMSKLAYANYRQAQGQSLPPALEMDVEVQTAKGIFAPDGNTTRLDVGSAGYGVNNAATQEQNLLQDLPALRAVMARFPNNPLPRAAFLTRVCNFGSLNVIDDHMIDDHMIEDHWVFDTVPTSAMPSSTMDLLKQCEQVAREGERLEPDNAYFPVALAHLHFAAYDNQTALADIDRASRKPRWEDYNSALIRGACRLQDAQLGVSSSVLHQTTFDTASFLYYSSLYNTARHLLLLAWKQEHAGNVEAGIALRGRMMRVGATIRDQAHGRFVSGPGEAMFLLACSRPKIQKERYIQGPFSPQDVADYPQYLRQHGHIAEADWVQNQIKSIADTDINPLYQGDPTASDSKNLPGYDPNYDPGIMMRCVLWFWGAGLFTLVEITVLLLAGGLAIWRNYRRRFSLNRPRAFARPVVWGIGFALPMIVCPLIVVALVPTEGMAVAWNSLPIIALLCLTLLVAGLIMRGMRDTALCALLTFAIACVLLGMALVQLGGAVLRADDLQAASSLYISANKNNLLELTSVALNMTLLTLTPLLLLVLWMAIRSWIRRVPLGWGVWRGLSAVLLPLLSLWLIVYAGVGLATTRAEAQADNAFRQLLDNENQYTRDMYREARRNTRQQPVLRALRLLTGDIHAANVAPPWRAATSTASAK